MSTSRDAIAALIKRRLDAWNGRDLGTLGRLFASDCTVESPTAGGIVTGRAAVQAIDQAWFAGFPDVVMASDDLFIDGDQIAWMLTARGTDSGGFMGLPPTGKAFELPMVVLSTMAGEAIAHERRIYDFTGMLVQIGLLKTRAIGALPPSAVPPAIAQGRLAPGDTGLLSREAIADLLGARREAWIRRDAAALAELHTADCIMDTHMAGRVQGRDAVARVYDAWWAAFPDSTYTSEQVIVDASRVAQVVTQSGTDTGGFLGLPPTNKPFRLPIVWLFTLRARAFVHVRPILDFTGLLVLIGLLKAKPA
jgi:predicted ester cyclase